MEEKTVMMAVVREIKVMAMAVVSKMMMVMEEETGMMMLHPWSLKLQ